MNSSIFIISSAVVIICYYFQLVSSSCSSACSTSCSVNKINPPMYDSDSLGIGQNMNNVCLPDDTIVPENDFVCYKHNWCNDGGCKLKERPKTGSTCNWNLITLDDSNPSFPIVQAQSPKHSCSSKNRYYNKLFCIYNISLPACANTNTSAGGVRVSFNDDDVDIVDNFPCKDYVQIIDNNGKFQKLCGDYNDLPDKQKQIELPSTNFLVVFFSDKTENAEGFSLRAECRL